MKGNQRYIMTIAAAALLLVVSASVIHAGHAWSTYHWERSSNPLQLVLGDNVSGTWDARLVEARDDWNVSAVLDISIGTGSAKPRNCRPGNGEAEICNASYGFNGWLGIAQIWIDGDHITKGSVKVNDTYHDSPPYNTYEWRQSVMCQEIGHIFGLGHQDENFNTVGTSCMDSSNPPALSPNQHDYDQLAGTYGHLDSDGGGKGGGPPPGKGKPSTPPGLEQGDLNDPSQWGHLIASSRDGRRAVFLRDIGHGQKLVTFVIWA